MSSSSSSAAAAGSRAFGEPAAAAAAAPQEAPPTIVDINNNNSVDQYDYEKSESVAVGGEFQYSFDYKLLNNSIPPKDPAAYKRSLAIEVAKFNAALANNYLQSSSSSAPSHSDEKSTRATDVDANNNANDNNVEDGRRGRA